MIKPEEAELKNKEVKLKKEHIWMDKISPQSFKENKTQATVKTTAASDEGVWQPLLFTSHRVQLWQRKEWNLLWKYTTE